MNFAPTIEEDVCCRKQDELDRLERIIQRRVNGRVRDLRVLILPNGLILKGRVATFHAKQLAQHAIMDACQLPILANEIEVDSGVAAPTMLVEC